MDTKNTVTAEMVDHIAVLANIPVTQQEKEDLAQGFTKTLAVVDKLNSLDTSNIEQAHQVTGLTNVLREDRVDEKRMFPQQAALQNAKEHHDGYFVVEQILEEK